MRNYVDIIIIFFVSSVLIVTWISKWKKSRKYEAIISSSNDNHQKITPEINEAYHLYWDKRAGKRSVKYYWQDNQLLIDRDGVVFILSDDTIKSVKKTASFQDRDAAIYNLKKEMKFEFNEAVTIVNMILNSY